VKGQSVFLKKSDELFFMRHEREGEAEARESEVAPWCDEADAPTMSEANGRGWSGQRDGRANAEGEARAARPKNDS
jgi:hypothetical protein